MVWQRIVKLQDNNNTALVESRLGKQYVAEIKEDVDTDKLEYAMGQKIAVYGDVHFISVKYGSNQVARILSIHIGEWNE